MNDPGAMTIEQLSKIINGIIYIMIQGFSIGNFSYIIAALSHQLRVECWCARFRWMVDYLHRINLSDRQTRNSLTPLNHMILAANGPQNYAKLFDREIFFARNSMFP